MNQIQIGRFIAECRKKKKMTQEELATILGVSSKSISRWENGINMPDYSLLKSLASTLGVTINELLSGTKIKKDKIIEEYENNLVNVLKEYKKMKKAKNTIFLILCISLYFTLFLSFVIIIPNKIIKKANIEVNTNISDYNNYIGKQAKKEYRNKWGMNEEIFPSKINDNMNIKDYKMVYYNPWDAQYLSYLAVEYNDEHYESEKERLESLKKDEYVGIYNVKGFSKYNLLAIYTDDYHGFVYAITDNQNTIIYVELIFCNYFYDIDYKEYIKEEYLPDNFDATEKNDYRCDKLNETK